jgi:hypothetical protein
MKLVAVTMGKSLEVFLGLFDLLKGQLNLEPPGIFVADSYYYKKTEKKYESLKEATILKEWELTKKGKHVTPDANRIRKYEEKLGDPTLWNALLADRRIFFGKLCKVRQDYKPRFTKPELLGILETFLIETEDFLDKTQPDLVLGFGTATLGDYLFYLFSRAKQIPYFQLKATKVNNYISLNDTAVGISEHFKKRFRSNEPLEEPTIQEARSFLDSIPTKGVQYEGAILSGRKRMMGKLFRSLLQLARGLVSSLRIWLDPVTRGDNHLPPPFFSSVYEGIVQPVRAFTVQKRFRFLKREELDQTKPFLFYPLHFEPEVSLQVFGRPYQNQIEVVRNLALAVPVNMTVVVKEHPRSLGFRKLSYYRKLLEIPNVKLVDPFLPAIEVVKKSEAVAVVSGTIGFEAAVCKKPVIVLGTTAYTLLPETMVRRVHSIRKIGDQLRDLFEKYTYDRLALERYVGVIIEESVPVDLYTVLFDKRGRFSQSRQNTTIKQKKRIDYQALANYFQKRISTL